MNRLMYATIIHDDTRPTLKYYTQNTLYALPK